MNNKKPTILIITIIILFFSIIAIAAVKLSKTEEKTNFTVSSIPKLSSTKPSGLIVSYSDTIQALNPADATSLSKDKITIQDWKNNNSTTQLESVNTSRISPDGKYLAVISPDPTHIEYTNKNLKLSSITLYNLADNTSKKIITADKDTLITSLAWDWSSKSIGFITTKRQSFSSYDNTLSYLFPNQENFTKYLNRVNIQTGENKTQKYPDTSKQYSSSFGMYLLALKGNTFFIADRGQLITINGDKATQMEIGEATYSITEIYFSPDYKCVAFYDVSNVLLLDLEHKTKQNFQMSTGNLQAIKIHGIAISPDHQHLAFIKSVPSNKQSSPNSTSSYSSPYESDSSSPTTVETIWHYSLKDKSFQQVRSQPYTADAYSYTSNSSLAFSPDNNQLAIITSDNSASQPFISQDLTIYDLKTKSSKKTPVPNINSLAKIIAWH